MNLNLESYQKRGTKTGQSCQCCAESSPIATMILLLVFGLLCVTGAEEQVEEPQPQCNCSRVLNFEETTTEVSPTFPTTSFTCWGRYDGYYADVEVDCTIFHYCQTWQFPSGLNETVKWDFACPQSTIFNQKILSCTPPNISFDCQESPNYYWVNYNFTLSSTATPVEEFTTPNSNLGQQLIVGGFEPHSQPTIVSPEPASHFSESPQESAAGATSQIPTPHPNLGHDEIVEQHEPNYSQFPIIPPAPTSSSGSGSGEQPDREFQPDSITFPS